ncbi:MAG: SEL1-like repeat protein, partial [Syntrophobacteraceae bacterium]
QGNANAQFLLGAIYYDGKGAPQDYSEAIKWYRKAAERGAGSGGE